MRGSICGLLVLAMLCLFGPPIFLGCWLLVLLPVPVPELLVSARRRSKSEGEYE